MSSELLINFFYLSEVKNIEKCIIKVYLKVYCYLTKGILKYNYTQIRIV